MPIYLDFRDDKGRTPKSLGELRQDFKDKDIMEYEKKLAIDRAKRIELIIQAYPHLKGVKIL